MSFGFGIGDFLAVAELSWNLYSQVYKVARDAPEELRGLNQELGNLSNTYKLLVEELSIEDSLLRQSGDQRINIARRINDQVKETLEKMQKLSERYASLQLPAEGQQKRSFLRIRWDQVKYSKEAHKINDLRAKLMFHNSQMTLLLQGAQNSSLERIERQTAKIDQKLDELRRLFVSDGDARDQPLLKAPLDQNALVELTDLFLQKTELDGKPWASIGIDTWLQAAKWWLLKAESSLDSSSRSLEKYNQAYANLLKASWILTEIVSRHPQRTHMGTASDRRTYYIRSMTQGAISKLEESSNNVPLFEDLQNCDLDIWEASRHTDLAPAIRQSMERPGLDWQAMGGDIFFQCFVMYEDPSVGTSIECICMLVIPNQTGKPWYLNLILQTFSGQDVVRKEIRIPHFLEGVNSSHHQSFMYPNLWSSTFSGGYQGASIKFMDPIDKMITHCIFSGALEFAMHPQRRSERIETSWGYNSVDCCLPRLDPAMVYLVALLQSRCPLPPDDDLPKRGYLTPTRIWDPLMRLKPAGNMRKNNSNEIRKLEAIVEKAIHPHHNESGTCCQPIWEDCSRMVCQVYPLGVWGLIVWYCETFEGFLELLRAAGMDHNNLSMISNSDQQRLIEMAILRPTQEFYYELVRYPGVRTGWSLSNISFLFGAVVKSDVSFLTHILENVVEGCLGHYAQVSFQQAYQALKWDHLASLPLLVPIDPGNFVDAIIWLMQHAECELNRFLEIAISQQYRIPTEGSHKYLSLFSSIALGYGWIIEEKDPETLRVFLGHLLFLGLPSNGEQFSRGCFPTQSAIFPALLSRDPLFLKEVLERKLASAQMGYARIAREYIKDKKWVERETEDFPPQNMPHLPLYIAVKLLRDFRVIEYLCQAGASLSRCRGTTTDIGSQPEIIECLQVPSTVEAAREDYLEVKQICYIIGAGGDYVCIFNDGINMKQAKCYWSDDDSLSDSAVWFMGRMLLLDGYYQPSEPSVIEYLQKKFEASLPSDYKEKQQWPTPLQTQENWDEWRTKAVEILKRYHVQQEGLENSLDAS